MTHEEMSRRGGIKGGNRHTEAQKRARSENGKKATGRPRGSKNKPKNVTIAKEANHDL